MTLNKPPSVQRSEFKSAKWDEITEGRNFQTADIPVLAMLCHWYEVVERCIADLEFDDGMRVAYANDLGDIKAFPQLSTMKQASAEIRAINKQLGINDEVTDKEKPKVTQLHVFQTNRAAKAKNKVRAS